MFKIILGLNPSPKGVIAMPSIQVQTITRIFSRPALRHAMILSLILITLAPTFPQRYAPRVQTQAQALLSVPGTTGTVSGDSPSAAPNISPNASATMPLAMSSLSEEPASDYYVQVAPVVAEQASGVPANVPTRYVFFDQTSTFNYTGGYVILSTCPGGNCTIVADDAIRISITRPDGTVRVVEFDFYTADFPPASLTSLFQPGVNSVWVELIDLMGPRRGSPRPFYLVASASPPAFATLPVESAPAGTRYNGVLRYTGYTLDPVHSYSGSFTYTHTDMAIKGRGPAIVFERTYNSNDTRVGPLGVGFTHSYNIRLRDPGDNSGNIILVDPQGRSDFYTPNADGSFTPPPGVYTTLGKNGDGTYTAILKDQTTWTFSAIGQLLRIQDKDGNISRLSYNEQNQLISVEDPAGRGSITLAHNAQGLIASVTDWQTPARTVYYSYDAQGRLAGVTDRASHTTTYSYDGASGRISTITDANGHVAVSNTYDSTGRVVSQRDAAGVSTGAQTTFTYTDNPDGTRTSTVRYPVASFEPSWAPTVEDTYDSQARLVRRVTKPTSKPAEWVTEQYAYDSNFNRISAIDGRGAQTLMCYDIDYTGAPQAAAQARGNLSRIIEPAPESGASRPVTLYQHDSKNNLLQQIAPMGVNGGPGVSCSTDLSGSINTVYATDYQYDQRGADLLAVSRYSTDPQTGALVPSTTRYEYNDPNNPGLPTRIISPMGNTGSTPDYTFAVTLEYYQPGTLGAGMLSRQTEPTGAVTTFAYDRVGRQSSRVDPNGNAPGGIAADHTWSHEYDNEDRVLVEVAPAPTAGGVPIVKRSFYDAVGNQVVHVDENGQVKRFVYDERDNLKEVHESPSSWTDPEVEPADAVVTAYLYDPFGNQQRVTQAKGDPTNERVTDYKMDALHHMRKEIQYPVWPSTASLLVTEQTYDLDGNLSTKKQPSGQVTSYGYDALNQLRTINYSDGVTPNVRYTYNLNGKRTTMVDGTGTTLYTYDEVDRPLSITSPSPDGPKFVRYSYDRESRLTSMVYPGGLVVYYTYDSAGRLRGLVDSGGRTVTYEYFADGMLRSATNPNGTVAQYDYDNAERLRQVWNQLGDNTISRHTYSLDAAGNRTQVDEVLPENGVVRPIEPSRMSTTQYGYDHLYRLVNESGPRVQANYVYDPANNRTSMTWNGQTTKYAYDRADRITRAGSIGYTVDANGNVVARGKERFTYDQENRMVESRMPQPTQSYFDGDGKRVRSNVDQGPMRTRVYDITRGEPLLIDDGRRLYIWGVGLAYALDGNSGLEVYHSDGLGSVRAVTYANSNVAQTYQTDAFGVVVRTQGTRNQPFQFAGEERDKETGFINLRSRNYEPSIGRFMQRDTFAGFSGSPQTLNRYTYVDNNPVNAVDPSGHSSSKVLIASFMSGRSWATLDIELPIWRKWIFWMPTWNTDRLIFATGFIGLQGQNAVTAKPDGTINIGPLSFNSYNGNVGSTSGPLGITTKPGFTFEAKVPIPLTSYSFKAGVEISTVEVPRGQWLGAVTDVARNTTDAMIRNLPQTTTILTGVMLLSLIGLSIL